MRYGLIVFSNTDNLGDDIQSYATMAHLPHVDYVIERENMNNFVPNGNRVIAVIMAGWFLYSHLNWPPSPYIHPLNISMHFDTYYSKYRGNSLEKNMVLEGYGAKWLNLYGPVGARDYFTLNLLRGFGINSYFSGCITTTLKKFPHITKHNEIVAVDVSPQIVDYVKQNSHKNVIIKTHKIKLEAVPLKERFQLVEEYLKLYQGASLVITSRLHAALPCLALGTPVLFIKDTKFFNRIGTYMPCIYNEFEDNILRKTFHYNFDNPPHNPTEYLKIQQYINKTCKDFINKCEQMPEISVTDKMIQSDMRAREHTLKILKERNNKKQQITSNYSYKNNIYPKFILLYHVFLHMSFNF